MEKYTRTYFDELDKFIGGGLCPGALYVVGSRPGMGKTSFILNVITNILSNETGDQNIVFISTKDNQEVIKQKMTSIITSNPVDSILTSHSLSKMDNHYHISLFRKIDDGCLTIKSITFPSVKEIIDLLGSIRCDLLCFDVIQDFVPIDEPQSLRDKEYLDTMKSLKSLAMKLQIPIIIGSDVNVTAEKRKGSHMPFLRDLSGSLEIAKCADVVMFLLRPAYYQLQKNQCDHSAILNIAKNNFGSISSILLNTQLSCLQFKNEERYYSR
jgi:replicative DNA helicase